MDRGLTSSCLVVRLSRRLDRGLWRHLIPVSYLRRNHHSLHVAGLVIQCTEEGKKAVKKKSKRKSTGFFPKVKPYSLVSHEEFYGWVPRAQKLRSRLLRIQSHQRFSFFKAGVSQNIALRASLTARNSAFLISDFAAHSALFPKVLFKQIVMCLELSIGL